MNEEPIKLNAMLTTYDNPYSPVTEYEKWNKWDQDMGYYTNDYLARITPVDDDLDDDTQQLLIDASIMSIIDNDDLAIYGLVPITSES